MISIILPEILSLVVSSFILSFGYIGVSSSKASLLNASPGFTPLTSDTNISGANLSLPIFSLAIPLM